MLAAYTTEQAAIWAQHVTIRWNDAISQLPLDEQFEWRSVQGRCIEALYETAEKMMVAESAYDVALLDVRHHETLHDTTESKMVAESAYIIALIGPENEQAMEHQDFRSRLAAHGVD